MSDRLADLTMMAREAEDPEDRAWAQAQIQKETGKPLEAQHRTAGPWREGFVGRQPMNMMDAVQKRPREKMGAGTAGLLGAGQGGSFGTADELTGVGSGLIEGTGPGRWLGERFGLLSRDALGNLRGGDGRMLESAAGQATPEASFGAGYRGGRDSAREDLEQAREDQPVAAYGAEIGASLFNPIKVPIKGPVGPGVGKALGRIGTAGVRGGIEGAAYAAGGSTNDVDTGDFLRDVGGGAALGGVIGGVTQTVPEAIKGAGNYITKNLKKRVVNEFAEGLESATTPTQRQHLNRAQDDIYREVTTGPDAKAVRGTVYQGAAEGREILKPIVDEVGKANKANYETFSKAGRGEVDAADYLSRLKAKADEADNAGDIELFEAISSYANTVEEAAKRTGSLALTRLRGMTTKVQKHAASAVGGMNKHAAAELEGRLMATATEAMDDSLSIAAKGSSELEAVAQNIRENNRRIYALKTVDKGLHLREHKEGTAPGLLVRGAKAAATPGALAAGAAIAGEDEDKFQNAMMGGAVGLGLRGLVPLAKLAQRKGTDIAIKTQMPNYGGPTADSVSRAVRPFVPPLSTSILDAILARRQQEQKR